MGIINIKNPKQMITGILLVVIAVSILPVLLPTLITNIINLSTISNLSFASFFASGGVVLLMVSVAVVLAILGVFLGGKGAGR